MSLSVFGGAVSLQLYIEAVGGRNGLFVKSWLLKQCDIESEDHEA